MGAPGKRPSRDHVLWGYRLLLDREPESEEVVAAKLQTWHTTRELLRDFLTSAEFQVNNYDLMPIERERRIVIKELPEGPRLFIDLADFVGLTVLRDCFELGERAFVSRTVRPGDSVVDAGANVGVFTILMASLVGPTGRVYAYEPFPAHIDLLERSIAENRYEDRVRVTRGALGTARADARLVVIDGTANAGGFYLLPEGAACPAGHRTEAVAVVALDEVSLGRPIRFIKADVEGAEPLVFRGAAAILREDRPVILSEVHPDQLARVSGCTPARLIADMAARGYECRLLNDGAPGERVVDVTGHGPRSVVFLPR